MRAKHSWVFCFGPIGGSIEKISVVEAEDLESDCSEDKEAAGCVDGSTGGDTDGADG